MKKKKLIIICIIILLIIGGCVQQLNDDSAISVFTPAPIVNAEDTSNDTDNTLPNNSNNTTQADNTGLEPKTGSLPAINEQEDSADDDDNSADTSEKEDLTETPELSEFPEIPYENRVYFTNISEPSKGYKFSSGFYTEQDIKLLSILLQLIPSKTLNEVLQTFDSLLTPDINLSQFTQDDFLMAPFRVNIDKTATYYKEEGLAFLSITKSNNTGINYIEYILVFREASEGLYTPSCVICINPADKFLQTPEKVIITNNEKKYLLTTGQIMDYEDKKQILTRLYDCDTGELVFSLPYKVTLSSSSLSENYSVTLKMDSLKNYSDGFTIDATTKAEHIVRDVYFAPNRINLLSEQDITIFVVGSMAYVEDGPAALFANFAPVKPWQYKTIFKDSLNELKKNDSKLISQWAADMLSYNRNIAESSNLPKREFDIFTYEYDEFPIRFFASELYEIVKSAETKEHSSFAGIMENYISSEDGYDLSLLAPLEKFRWSRISGDVECRLVFPDNNMDYVLIEAKFTYKKQPQNVFLVFYANSNHNIYKLIDVQTATNMDNAFYYSMSDGLLRLNIPSPKYGEDNYYSRFYHYDKLALEILSDYTAPSGLYYNISLERDNINSSLYYCKVTAYLSQGVKAVVYELPICLEYNVSFTDDNDALKLLLGKPEEHEAFKILLHDSLDKIAKSDYYHIEYRTEAENVLKYFGWL